MCPLYWGRFKPLSKRLLGIFFVELIAEFHIVFTFLPLLKFFVSTRVISKVVLLSIFLGHVCIPGLVVSTFSSDRLAIYNTLPVSSFVARSAQDFEVRHVFVAKSLVRDVMNIECC